ncbi:MAG: cobalt transporter CbiM [Planctomycetes bacterium]|nr:cobalt transporter CbiM [Planctomycetota bacterium]
MHIPDGYLGPATYGSMFVVMAPAWAAAGAVVRKRLRARQVPYLALAGAFSFVVMMFNFPIPGGSTGHATGAVLAAIVTGPWAACLALSVTVVLQALLAGDGGVTCIGANCFSMAFVTPVVGWLAYRLLAGKCPAGATRRAAAAAAGGFVGLNLSALTTAFLLGLQPLLAHAADGSPLYCPLPLTITVPAMMAGHILYFGWIEAAITGLAVAYLGRTAPEVLATGEASTSLFARPALPWLAVTALALLTPLGLLLPALTGAGGAFGEASPADLRNPAVAGPSAVASVPPGMERLHGKWTGPLPNYGLPNQAVAASWFGKSAAYVLAAFVGIAAVALVVFVLGRRLLAPAPRGPDAR